MEVREEHPSKKPISLLQTYDKEVIFSNKITDVNFSQPPNRPPPTSFTVFGIVAEISPEPAKAQSPMLVTLLGIVSEVREEQLLKASFPMLVTLLGIAKEVRE